MTFWTFFLHGHQLIEQSETPVLIPEMTSEEMFFQQTTVPLLQKAYQKALAQNMVRAFHSANTVKRFLQDDTEQYAVFCGMSQHALVSCLLDRTRDDMKLRQIEN